MNGSISEKELIQGCAKRNPECQRMLYNRFQAKMYAVCLRFAKDQHTAQDLLQDGFVKVFTKIDEFKYLGSFEGWMRRIFTNVAIEHFRRSVHLYPISELTLAGLDYYEETTIEKLSAEELINMLQELSPGYRTVFNLYVVEGYAHKEIAKKLGISEGTSKSQLARAKSVLRNMIEKIEKVEQNALVQ